MRFYAKTHQHYCGIDLHARIMYLCILNPGEPKIAANTLLPIDRRRPHKR